MSKIYNISLSEDTDTLQVVSKEYIDTLVNIILARINEYINSELKTSNTMKDIGNIPCEYEDVSIKNKTIYSKDVITDQNHRYISDALLGVFKEKPSTLEMENAIADAKMSIDGELNDLFTKLLNTPDALDKIKILMNIISSNSTFSALMESISDKIGYYEFNYHTSSNIHLTNNDRKALNSLIELIKNGGIDWEADSSSICSIKNKPKSIKADGGDADTIDGYSVNEIRNKQFESLIIGTTGGSYDDTSVNIFTVDDIDNIFNSFKNSNNTYISIKSGNYKIDNWDLNCDSEITINGCNGNTVITANEITLTNVILKDIKIDCPNVRIASDCTLENVQFVNSKASLVNSMRSRILFCKMDNSIIRFEGACVSNIIMGNISTNGSKIICLGKNNIADNNIVM